MSETRPRPPTRNRDSESLSRSEVLKEELKLDPIELKQVRTRHNKGPDLLQIPYDYEARALDTTGDCSKGGPRVWVMTSTPQALRTIFTAIRTCYSPFDQAYIAYKEYFEYLNKPSSNNKSKKFPNDLVRLLSQVAKMRHLSTLEHVSFTFGIRCISRATLAQLTRHRIGWSYSVQSQRYVKQSKNSHHGHFEYITPPSIEQDDKAVEVYVEIMDAAQKAYDKLIELGIKSEDARYVIPNSATTNVTVTCNLRAFIDFYEKRNSGTHSQWEIQILAERMKNEMLEVEPGLKFLFDE